MSLQLITGAAGAGKSTYIYNMLVSEAGMNPKKNFLLIVPDQFTMQTQMDIVKHSPCKGIMNIDVLSFQRLTYRVFEEAGKPSEQVLEDTGKSLVIRRVAALIADKMPYIGRNLNKLGYIHEVKSSISEFMQYRISVKDLQDLAKSAGNGMLGRKLSDLATIYDEYLKYTKDKFITNEETLDVVCDKLDSVGFAKNSIVVLDGFTGFTPIQERVISKLLTIAEKVMVTVTIGDSEKLSEYGNEEKLFGLSRRTAHRLEGLAKDVKTEILQPINVSGGNVGKFAPVSGDNDTTLQTAGDHRDRFSDAPELRHLEQNLFRYPYKAYPDEPANIVMYGADTLNDEVCEAALRIHELVQNNGYAYRDIAIVTGNLEAYADLFEKRFGELGIPLFVDRTNKIILNPFVEYIESSMEMIIKDYSYESVFHFLRSGFTDIGKDETDRLDMYVKSLNLRGAKNYHKPFVKVQRGLKKDIAEAMLADIDATRAKLVACMEPLERPAATVSDYAKNLYDFIKSNNSFERLNGYVDMFTVANEPAKAKEYAQIYRLVMELLDRMVALIGDEPIDLEEFYRIFESGVEEMQVGTIPGSIDRIVVGDIERTRLKEVKALFLLGLNDSNVPRDVESPGILSGMERENLKPGLEKKGLDLAPSSREAMYTQRLYLYMNMCKPSQKLFLSCAGIDAEGKGMKPSYLCRVVTQLFPKLKVLHVDGAASADKIITAKDGVRLYKDLLREMVVQTADEATEKLARTLHNLLREIGEDEYKRAEEGAFFKYEADTLSEEIVNGLYGAVLEGSVSRMELFAKCAYAHFLNYGMKLNGGADPEFNRMDTGNVCHEVLNRLFSELEARNKDIVSEDDDELARMIEECVNTYCEEYEQGLLKSDEQSAYRIEKLKQLMKRTVDTLKFQLSKGSFRPFACEYPFTREIRISDEKRLRIRGKIDRIDLYSEGDRIYVKIVDYKSSGRKLDVTDIYWGISQQLMTYLSEAVENERTKHPDKEVVPAAVLYYAMQNPIVDISGESDDANVTELIRKELMTSGFIESSNDSISALDNDVADTGKSLVFPIKYGKSGLDSRSAQYVIGTDEMNNMMKYVHEKMVEIGQAIASGEISAKPFANKDKSACDYCGFGGICKFEQCIPGYTTRDGSEITDEEARQTVMGGVENGGRN